MSETGFTFGIGFTFIAKLLISPAQVFPEFVKLGVALKFEVIGLSVVLFSVVAGIFPVPEAGIPIAKSFCH